jgi:hypothetical protein
MRRDSSISAGYFGEYRTIDDGSHLVDASLHERHRARMNDLREAFLPEFIQSPGQGEVTTHET